MGNKPLQTRKALLIFMGMGRHLHLRLNSTSMAFLWSPSLQTIETTP